MWSCDTSSKPDCRGLCCFLQKWLVFQDCRGCVSPVSGVCVSAPKLGEAACFHPACFVCCVCRELLVDLTYCVRDGQLYCERHYADHIKPRCSACDEVQLTRFIPLQSPREKWESILLLSKHLSYSLKATKRHLNFEETKCCQLVLPFNYNCTVFWNIRLHCLIYSIKNAYLIKLYMYRQICTFSSKSKSVIWCAKEHSSIKLYDHWVPIANPTRIEMKVYFSNGYCKQLEGMTCFLISLWLKGNKAHCSCLLNIAKLSL